MSELRHDGRWIAQSWRAFRFTFGDSAFDIAERRTDWAQPISPRMTCLESRGGRMPRSSFSRLADPGFSQLLADTIHSGARNSEERRAIAPLKPLVPRLL